MSDFASNPSTYLGDGLYAAFDGYMFTLYASNGVEITNTVYLEPEALSAFLTYVRDTRAAAKVTK